MNAVTVAFYLFAFVAAVSALAMVANVRNPVAAAMSLVVTMIALGAIYTLLEAHLIAVLQIMIYAGAIVVVFLFVVMLLNLRRDAFSAPRQIAIKAVGAGVAGLAAAAALRWFPLSLPEAAAVADDFGGYRAVGRALYLDYVLPFEITSLLLLGAIVGAVVMALRRLD